MPARPYNPVYLQLHEFGEMLKDVVRHRDLRILVMNPEWIHRRKPPASNEKAVPAAADTATETAAP